MPVRIIAEIGINHDSEVERAKQLATIAKSTGCDYVKLQKREVELCYAPDELHRPCRSRWGDTIKEKLVGRELSWGQVQEFAEHCERIRIGWSSSCFDLRSLAELEKRFPSRPFNKIPSAMAIHERFLEAVAMYGRTTLISTGLCTDDQVMRAADIFDSKSCDYVLNHCVALYPCPADRLNLRVIPAMMEVFSRRNHCVGIGYSGHETGVLPAVIAAQLGATWIERHVTYDRAADGSDHAASLEPHGLHLLVRDLRTLDVILGTGRRELRGDEKVPVKHFTEEV
jgi:N-acetylneuraminate synthase